MASTSGSSTDLGERRQRRTSKKRRIAQQGQRMEIVPTVSLPVAETHAATRRDLRRLSTKILGKQELKWLDVYAANATAAANTATIVHLNPIPQGTTPVTRVGSSCQMTSVQGRIEAHMAAANVASSAPTIRIILLADSEVNAALPATSDILDTTIVTDLTLSPYNLTQLGPKQRFKILADTRKTLTITARDSSGAPFYVYQPVLFRFKKQIKRICQWSAANTNGVIGNMLKNSVILWMVSDTGSTLFNYGTRVIFKDD